MDTPGNILRSEREKQKKSVHGIANSLRIKVEYLEAIEENRFHLLPAEVYTKAYLRLYAETLGLEGNDILNVYKSQMEADSGEGQETVPAEKAFNYKPVFIIASLLIIVISAFILSGQNKQTHVTDVATQTGTTFSETEPVPAKTRDVPVKTSPAAAKTPDVPVETSPAAAEPRDVPVETAPAAAEPRDVPVETAPAAAEIRDAAAEVTSVPVKTGETDRLNSVQDKKLTLRITATELTWISISIDGDKHQEWSMRSGDIVTVTASDRFEIKVGNAGGTRLHFNNEDIGELGPHGKIIDITLP